MNELQTNVLKDAKSIEWVQVVERDVSVFCRSLIFEGEKTKNFNPALGVNIPPIGDSSYRNFLFVPKDTPTNILHAAEQRAQKNGFRDLLTIGKECIAAGEKWHAALKKPKGSLTEQYRTFAELNQKFTPYLYVVYFPEKFLDGEVEKLIKSKVASEKEFKHYFENLVFVRKPNESTKELVDLLKLCKFIQTKNESLDSLFVQKKIHLHWKKYGWLKTRWHFEGAFSESEIKNRIQEYLEGNPAQELKKALHAKKHAEKVTREFIQKYQLNADEIALIDAVKEFVFLRTYRTETIYHANFLAQPMLEKVAQKIGLSFRDLTFLEWDEVNDLLNGKKHDFSASIEERKKGHCYIFCNDEMAIYSGKDLEKVEETGIFKLHEAEAEIKGQPAWPGKVQGIVRIVKSVEDLPKVQRGDILVAIMTFPQYIPAMERAAAFVTDEGGILCHAAIVSREMQKPCIIGTKTATRTLKDGDVVEVDANTGIIRVLRRA